MSSHGVTYVYKWWVHVSQKTYWSNTLESVAVNVAKDVGLGIGKDLESYSAVVVL